MTKGCFSDNVGRKCYQTIQLSGHHGRNAQRNLYIPWEVERQEIGHKFRKQSHEDGASVKRGKMVEAEARGVYYRLFE